MAKTPSANALKPAPAPAEADTLNGPDGFAVVLPAVAALAAVASIAAVNWSAQDRAQARASGRRKAQASLRDMEGCCLGLSEIFRRFHKFPAVFAGEGAKAALPMKFGGSYGRVAPDVARHCQQLVNDIASLLVVATQNSVDIMCAVEDGEIEAPETLFFAFAEQQERLNTLFKERASLKQTCDTGLDIADKLTLLVRELKKYKTA